VVVGGGARRFFRWDDKITRQWLSVVERVTSENPDRSVWAHQTWVDVADALSHIAEIPMTPMQCKNRLIRLRLGSKLTNVSAVMDGVREWVNRYEANGTLATLADVRIREVAQTIQVDAYALVFQWALLIHRFYLASEFRSQFASSFEYKKFAVITDGLLDDLQNFYLRVNF